MGGCVGRRTGGPAGAYPLQCGRGYPAYMIARKQAPVNPRGGFGGRFLALFCRRKFAVWQIFCAGKSKNEFFCPLFVSALRRNFLRILKKTPCKTGKNADFFPCRNLLEKKERRAVKNCKKGAKKPRKPRPNSYHLIKGVFKTPKNGVRKAEISKFRKRAFFLQKKRKNILTFYLTCGILLLNKRFFRIFERVSGFCPKKARLVCGAFWRSGSGRAKNLRICRKSPVIRAGNRRPRTPLY